VIVPKKIKAMQSKFKKGFLLTLLPSALALSFIFFTPSPAGGDVVEVYLNQDLLLRQFLHIDKEVKTISLANARQGDELRVYYSHCGVNGKNRSITLQNADHAVLKKWNYANAKSTAKSLMSCTVKDILVLEKNYHGQFDLVYTSAEIPEGKVLAVLNMGRAATP